MGPSDGKRVESDATMALLRAENSRLSIALAEAKRSVRQLGQRVAELEGACSGSSAVAWADRQLEAGNAIRQADMKEADVVEATFLSGKRDVVVQRLE